MRLSAETAHAIREQVSRIAPESDCYLFGSRVMDYARGGDIDLLLLTPEKLPLSQIRGIRRGILNVIGEQKLDIVNFPRSGMHPSRKRPWSMPADYESGNRPVRAEIQPGPARSGIAFLRKVLGEMQDTGSSSTPLL